MPCAASFRQDILRGESTRAEICGALSHYAVFGVPILEYLGDAGKKLKGEPGEGIWDSTSHDFQPPPG